MSKTVNSRSGNDAAQNPAAGGKARHEAKLRQLLERFPFLPDDALVSVDVVCALKGRCRASIWRDIKAGRVPAPVKVGPNCTRFRVGDLKAVL